MKSTVAVVKSAGEKPRDPGHQQPAGERSRHPHHRPSRPHPRGSDSKPQRRSQPRDLPKHQRREEKRSQPRDKTVPTQGRRHTQQPTIRCPICPTTFRGDRASGRDKHLSREHSLRLQWQCRFCPKQVGAARFRDLARHCATVHQKTDEFHIPMYQKVPTEGRGEVPSSTTASQQQPATVSNKTTASQQPRSTCPAMATASQHIPRRTSPRHHSQPAARGPASSNSKREREEEATAPQAPLPKKPYQRRGHLRSPSSSSSSSPGLAGYYSTSSNSDRPCTPGSSSPSQPPTPPAALSTDTSTPESTPAPTPAAAASPVVGNLYEDITPVTSMNLSQGSDLFTELINGMQFPHITPPKELTTTGTAITPPVQLDVATTTTLCPKQHRSTQTDGTVVVLHHQELSVHVNVHELHRTTVFSLRTDQHVTAKD